MAVSLHLKCSDQPGLSKHSQTSPGVLKTLSLVLMHVLWCLQSGAFGFFHDLAVTENYYILLQNPTKLNLQKLIFGYVPGEHVAASQSPAQIVEHGTSSFK
jgi:Retinal pigment epithelial membrane protein